jgi:hypothetical protein
MYYIIEEPTSGFQSALADYRLTDNQTEEARTKTDHFQLIESINKKL